MTGPLPMSERDLLDATVDLARTLHYLAYHTHNSRHSAAGFPDLVLAHKLSGALLVAELKTDRGRVSPAQDEWLRALAHRAVVFVWRPKDWHDQTIRRVLQRHARVARVSP